MYGPFVSLMCCIPNRVILAHVITGIHYIWNCLHWCVVLFWLLKNKTVMMTSSKKTSKLRVTGHLCGEFTGWPVNSPHKGQWRGALMFSLICVWINDWVNNREAGDFRRYRTHYDVIVMVTVHWSSVAYKSLFWYVAVLYIAFTAKKKTDVICNPIV